MFGEIPDDPEHVLAAAPAIGSENFLSEEEWLRSAVTYILLFYASSVVVRSTGERAGLCWATRAGLVNAYFPSDRDMRI